MARQKRVSVVADERIIDTAVVDDDSGDVVNYIDKYEIIPEGRMFRCRHWNGGAMPVELEGSFTSVFMAKIALARYYKRKEIPNDKRDYHHSGQGVEQGGSE